MFNLHNRVPSGFRQRRILVFLFNTISIAEIKVSLNIWDFLYVTVSYSFSNFSTLTAHANISKVPLILAYFMVILIALNLWVVVIVIGLKIWMIKATLWVFFFYMGDTSFTWSSKKQFIFTFSTCDEAEYVVATSCVCHSIWLGKLLKELWIPQEKPNKIYVDNSSVIAVAKNLVFHDRSKHINTRFHFL